MSNMAAEILYQSGENIALKMESSWVLKARRTTGSLRGEEDEGPVPYFLILTLDFVYCF